MVVKRHRDLNQSLQELLLRLGCRSPDVLQDFVRLEEGGAVKQLNSFPILPGVHAALWHSKSVVSPVQKYKNS
jgi:hypothetical protein